MGAGLFHILYDSDAGSSGKGAAVARLTEVLGIKNGSCNHGPNAGHFVEDEIGRRYLFKILPSAAGLRWMRRGSDNLILWIGPNSAFEPEQLIQECADAGFVPGDDLFIHGRAAITEGHHKAAEAPGGLQSTLHVSSTMSGAGATYAGKAMRQIDTRLACEEEVFAALEPQRFFRSVRDQLRLGHDFLHEVAQGFALSLDYGIQARHCTYRNCSALQAAADFGITPNLVGEVYANLRTFPIRVGNNYDAGGKQIGYSGDWYPDQIELDWGSIGRDAKMPMEEIERLYTNELTSVTKKLRRVASFSMHGTKYSAIFNGATRLVVNFTSYLDWASRDLRGGRKEYLAMSPKVRDFVEKLENELQIPVVMLGTGAKHESYVLPYGDVSRGALISTEAKIEAVRRFHGGIPTLTDVARFDGVINADSGT